MIFQHVVITERGWIAWFICAERCRFRRNTLVESGKRRVVVATVGAFYVNPDDKEPDTVGWKRYYETGAFRAKKDGVYWDADTTQRVGYAAQEDWRAPDADLRANQMHDNMVAEIAAKLERGEKL